MSDQARDGRYQASESQPWHSPKQDPQPSIAPPGGQAPPPAQPGWQAPPPPPNSAAVALAMIAAALAVLLTVGIAGWLAIREADDRHSPSVAVEALPPSATADGDGIIAVAGAPDEPHLIVYEDYQCPACARYHEAVKPAIAAIAAEGLGTVEFRTMTFLDTSLDNTSSQLAAEAAACADTVGSYRGYHDALLAGQPQEGLGFSVDELRSAFAEQAGMAGDQLTEFQTCVDSRRMQGFVLQVDHAADLSGVDSTPRYVLNGKTLPLEQLTSESLLAQFH